MPSLSEAEYDRKLNFVLGLVRARNEPSCSSPLPGMGSSPFPGGDSCQLPTTLNPNASFSAVNLSSLIHDETSWLASSFNPTNQRPVDRIGGIADLGSSESWIGAGLPDPLGRSAPCPDPLGSPQRSCPPVPHPQRSPDCWPPAGEPCFRYPPSDEDTGSKQDHVFRRETTQSSKKLTRTNCDLLEISTSTTPGTTNVPSTSVRASGSASVGHSAPSVGGHSGRESPLEMQVAIVVGIVIFVPLCHDPRIFFAVKIPGSGSFIFCLSYDSFSMLLTQHSKNARHIEFWLSFLDSKK